MDVVVMVKLQENIESVVGLNVDVTGGHVEAVSMLVE